MTGATGFVGGHIIRALRERGCQVRCIVRSPDKAIELLNLGAEVVPGDVNDQLSLERACSGVKTVINLVAIIREHGEATFEKINVKGTENLVSAAQNAGVSRFIQMSALGARNDIRYIYIHSKWQAEEIVQQSTLSWTIFRPSLIYGKGFGFFDRLMQSLRLCPPPLAPLPGGGRTKFQPIAVEDVARCVLQSLENPDSVGKIYEIGGPEHLSYAEMLDALLSVLGEKRIKVPVPLPLMKLVVPIMCLVLRDPPVTLVELKQLDIDNITDVDAVENHFGFMPKYLREGLGYLVS